MTVTLANKKAIAQEVGVVAKQAVSAVIADYRGMSVNDMTRLRSQARQVGVYLKVVRNTLSKRAFANTDFECLNDRLTGSLFMALSINAPSDAARLLRDFSKTCEALQVKALAVGGVLYEASQIEAVASLPTYDEALAKLIYVMKAPIEKLVRTLAAPHTKMVRTLAAVRDTKM